MARKFKKFYFEKDEKIHYLYEIMDAIKKDRTKALEYYEGNIFCPVCRMAPLSINSEHEYLYVSPNHQQDHDEECPMRVEYLGRRELLTLYDKLTDEELEQKMNAAINKGIRLSLGNNNINNNVHGNNTADDDEVNEVNYGGRIRRILDRSIYSNKIYFNLGLSTLYYGLCYIEQEHIKAGNSDDEKISKSDGDVIKEKNKAKNEKDKESYWILHILNKNDREPLLSIKLTKIVKGYFKYDFSDPDKLYNVAFVLELYRKNDSYTGSLRNSRYFKCMPVE